MHPTPSYRWLRFVTVGLCTVALSGCIPTDTTIRKGGVAIHVNPSEATRTGRFRTGDGWDVTLQIARISLSARISTCVDVSEYGEDSYAAYSGGGDNEGDARKPILLEIRAADASSRCILHVEPQGTYARRDSNGVVQDADPNTLDAGNTWPWMALLAGLGGGSLAWIGLDRRLKDYR